MKQLAFVAQYCIDRNATQAAIHAGYAPKNARITASQLLTKPNIQAELNKKLNVIAKRNDITVDRIVQELTRIGTVDIRDAFDENGNLKPIKEIPEDVARAIAGIEVDDLFEGSGREKEKIGYTRKIRLTDKVRALETLGKHFKMFGSQEAPRSPEQHLHLHFEDKNTNELAKEIMSQLPTRKEPESSVPA